MDTENSALQLPKAQIASTFKRTHWISFDKKSSSCNLVHSFMIWLPFFGAKMSLSFLWSKLTKPFLHSKMAGVWSFLNSDSQDVFHLLQIRTSFHKLSYTSHENIIFVHLVCKTRNLLPTRIFRFQTTSMNLFPASINNNYEHLGCGGSTVRRWLETNSGSVFGTQKASSDGERT